MTGMIGRGATTCRFCGSSALFSVVDLGLSPLCETVVAPDSLEQPESFYPLHVRACEACWLVQIPEVVPREEIFIEYAYFSSTSDSWLEHARNYVEMISRRLSLGRDSLVVELASNDGYLLQNFVDREIPVLGIDPAANVAEVARERGVPTLTAFFGLDLAERVAAEHGKADLILGNNVLAQVPDLNDFVAGVAALLDAGGIATFEFPHLAALLDHVEYDTIYHEHFSYFSLSTAVRIFEAQGLAVFDVDELATHGGSLRVYCRHAHDGAEPDAAVAELLAREAARGLTERDGFMRFRDEVHESKRALLDALIDYRRSGRQVVGYGAPGKGNTLLNYCGIRTDLLEYTVDRNTYKQGMYTPGTRIPIYAPDRIGETRPDVIVILPWNLAEEIAEQLAYTSDWGARLVVPIPRPRVIASG
jgi:hypothetical protein